MGGGGIPQPMLGAAIRAQRELAGLPMRHLAATVGISNPYLSQIERGLRAPSDGFLEAIAASLETSVDHLYAQAGIVAPADVVDDEPDAHLEAQIRSATELTGAQRRAPIQIYRGFVDANAVRRQRGSAS